MINSSKIKKILFNGGVGILATDTIYGLVGSALNKKTVKNIYKLRKRDLKKKMIILISSIDDLKIFGVKIDKNLKNLFKNFWPGPMSIDFSCKGKKFKYLHRGTKTLAFRLPKKKSLINILKSVGPLVAPSANLSGMPPAKTIKEAKKYFGNKVDFYADSGKISGQPSTLIAVRKNVILIKRQGAVKIERILKHLKNYKIKKTDSF